MPRLLCLALFALALPAFAADRPNVVVIITDDQGYGDIAAHGNPVIKTPNMDKLYRESVRLTDYHVDPTCAPTRAALMSGRYSTRTGVWHTINGRSMLAGDELTLAEVFKANGYKTAMFGKWHLGDNFPCRPQDQGFDHVVWHKGGGITQGPDYFGNDYFDDTYEVNGKYEKFEGYCTDIWFDEAMDFIQKKKDEPFFVYLSTNAPHGPFLVADEYSDPYMKQGVPATISKFYGMITNIDDNLAKLRTKLDELGLTENTLLVFTTDNGSTVGYLDRKSKYPFFNAGMRGYKGMAYEGGHRVPFFMHWPGGGLTGGKDIDTLCAHIDVLPTLVDLLAMDKPKGKPLDGISLKPAIEGGGDADQTPARTLFASVQRQYIPPKWVKSTAMTQRWRLIDGKALYDIIADPGQTKDVAGDHPEVVEKLRSDYEAWWTEMEPSLSKVVRYHLGGDENPMTLMTHDLLMKKGNASWYKTHVLENALINGPFMVDVKKAGKYRITPMRWPEYVDKPSGCIRVSVDIASKKNAAGKNRVFEMTENRTLDPAKPAQPIEVTLPDGEASLTTTLTREDGKTFGAYYVKIEYLGEDEKD